MFVPLLFIYLFFSTIFLTSFRQRQTIASFHWLSTTLYSGKHSLLSLRTQQAHSIFFSLLLFWYIYIYIIYIYIYILFLECHSYRSGTVNSPYKTQYYYSCRHITATADPSVFSMHAKQENPKWINPLALSPEYSFRQNFIFRIFLFSFSMKTNDVSLPVAEPLLKIAQRVFF